jgi:hypothetical protein
MDVLAFTWYRNAIVFGNMKPVLGRPGAFFGTPISIAPFAKAFAVSKIGDAPDPSDEECLRVIEFGNVVVPLGRVIQKFFFGQRLIRDPNPQTKFSFMCCMLHVAGF